jgi:hypothetical protein
MTELRELDSVAVANGLRTSGRNEVELRADGKKVFSCHTRYLTLIGWTLALKEGVMQGKPDKSMIPHLIKCTKVCPEIREKAKQMKAKPHDENSNVPAFRPSVTPAVSRTTTPASSRPPLSSIQSWLASSNITFSEPTSDISTNPRPAKQLRNEDWTASLHEEFAGDLLKVFVSAGFPWNGASDPELRLFCDKWIPGSKVPDRRVLSGRLLDKGAAGAESRMKKRIEGKLATGQCHLRVAG